MGFSCPDLWPFEAIGNRVLWEAEMQAAQAGKKN